MLDSPPAAASTLLGAPPRSLRLRIRGGARDGQIIRLSDSKCLVGADARCHVQLPDSSEIDCYILRGSARTVVRTLRPGVRVNGVPVGDAVIRTGDTIDLGNYSIDVLRAPRRRKRNASDHPVETGDAAKPQSLEVLTRIDRCESRLDGQLSQVITQLEASHAAILEQLPYHDEHSLDASASLPQALDRLFEDQRSLLSAEAQRLESRHVEIDAESRQMLERWKAQWDEVTERLSASQDRYLALDATWSQWEELRRGLLADFQCHQQALSDLRTELNARQTQLELAQAELIADRQTMESERKSLDSEKEELTSAQRALQALQAAVVPDHQPDLADSASQWQEHEQALAERTRELDRWQSELELRAREFAEREMHESASDQTIEADLQHYEHLRSELELQQAALATRIAELDAARLALEEREAVVEQDVARERELLSQVREQLAEERSSLEHRQTAWLLEHAQQQAELDARGRQLASQEEQLRSERDRLESMRCELETSRQQATAHAPSYSNEAPSSSNPQTSDDVFHRLQVAGILKSECNDALEQQQTSESGIEQSDGADSDDDTINQYMRNLLERTRQSSHRSDEPRESIVSSVLKSFAGTHPESEEVATVNQGQPDSHHQPHQPVRQQRRASVELPQDITAMRELANLSAQAALARHYRRQQQYAFGTKIGIFLIALTAGAFGLLQHVPHDGMFFYASLASLLIAVVWGVQLTLIVLRILWTFRLPKLSIETPVAAEILDPVAPECGCEETCNTVAPF